MRIGIDARELCGRATGAGRYLAGLLRQWAVSDRARRHEFLLYSAEPVGLSLDARRFPTRLVPGPGNWQWEQMKIPRSTRADHLDRWFAPAYTAPLRLEIPTIVAIHDLSFVAHPEWFRVREGVRRRWVTRQSARAARAIVTISEFSKRELIERLDIPADRIRVIPPGVVSTSPQSPTPNPQPSIPNPKLPIASSVLYVGSIFNRRHVPDLIRAFGPVARSHAGASLDIVGDNRSYPRQDLRRTIEAEGLPDSVHWHEYVTEAELHDLYSRARVFAFLSEYEGLGLTPLEALAAGVPPVLLDTPIARESCGDAALYVPANDLRAVTQALERLLFDDAARERLLTAAPGVLARYSWPRAAHDTLSVFEAT